MAIIQLSFLTNKVCTKCKQELPFTSFHSHKHAPDGYNWWCKDCTHKYHQQNPEVGRRNAQKYRARHPEAVLSYQRAYEASHLQKRRDAALLRSQKVKQNIVEAYGGQCVYCGECRLPYLTIDHINQDGATQRRNAPRSWGMAFYNLLRKQGYPSEFRCLCYNCNLLAYLESRPEPSQTRTARNSRKLYHKRKLALLQMLGGCQCVVCGIEDFRLLTIHHINNDGAEHRRAVGKKGCKYLTAILKSGNYDGLEVRCYSCNSGAPRKRLTLE
jgi:hypothetical protein